MNSHPQKRRRSRILWWSLALLTLATLALPLSGYLYVGLTGNAVAATQTQTQTQTNPRANYWRAVREGDKGYTAVEGQSTNVLIQNGGENWRQLRNGLVANIGAWVLAGVLALIVIIHFAVGASKVEQPLSGKRMPRWSVSERTIHWYTAILFIVLALTGLSILFGRAVLIPLMGLDGFAAYASVAKLLHNYLGPFFLVGVLAEVLAWIRYSGFNKDDWQWLKRFGGLFGGQRVHAGRTNGGEKLWFWFIATAGLIGVGVTGLLMDFPNFGQSRETMQIANLIHASLAILWIGIALGHIYIGTLGTEGALDGMVKGHVSKEWMQQHHDRWHDKLEQEGQVVSETETGRKAQPGISGEKGS